MKGSYADDVVAVEYFGGVLASSRTEVGRDDRGSRLSKIRLTTCQLYQIRSHYLIYSTISDLFSNSEYSFDIRDQTGVKMQSYSFLSKGYYEAMAFTHQEWENPQILSHIFHGLAADGLIDIIWSFGSRETLKKDVSGVPSDGIVCAPSTQGAELLLWAFGHGDKKLDFLLTREFSSEIEGIPKSVSNAVPVQSLKDKST